ncbi:MAG: protein kinase [Chloroflexi bacterium]|nr:protein kinase [Chloroflexota bacterium]
MVPPCISVFQWESKSLPPIIAESGHDAKNKSWIGQVLGDRYTIESLLGRGGMSSVYRAADKNLKRDVALKIIHPHLTKDPKFVQQFEQEATAVAQLRHQNIVRVYDIKREEGLYYIVMEYIPGETLAQN